MQTQSDVNPVRGTWPLETSWKKHILVYNWEKNFTIQSLKKCDIFWNEFFPEKNFI